LAKKQTGRPMNPNEDPDISPSIYSQLIFDKDLKIHDGEKTASQQMLLGKLDIHMQKTEIRKLPFTNSKWIKDLNIRPETLKQLQEAVGNILEQIDIGNDFLNRTQKSQHLRETMNKWDCIKLKSFCTTKETITILKKQPTEWEKIFASY
jgi:hypothetical protein